MTFLNLSKYAVTSSRWYSVISHLLDVLYLVVVRRLAWPEDFVVLSRRELKLLAGLTMPERRQTRVQTKFAPACSPWAATCVGGVWSLVVEGSVDSCGATERGLSALRSVDMASTYIFILERRSGTARPDQSAGHAKHRGNVGYYGDREHDHSIGPNLLLNRRPLQYLASGGCRVNLERE